jgi:putative SOS response-associated peptidase YedK
VWKHPEGYLVPSYTIITKTAQKEFSTIHPRMPVILPQDHLDEWLKTGKFSVSSALELANNTNLILEKYLVSPIVNSVKNNSQDCILPIDDISP